MMAEITLDDLQIDDGGQPAKSQLTLDDIKVTPMVKAKVTRPKSAEPLVVKPKAEIYKTLGEMSTPEYAIQQQYKLKKPTIKVKGKMPDSQAFTDKVVGQMQGYNLGPDGKPATAFKLPEETTEDFLQRAGDLQRAKDQQDQATRMKGRTEAAAKMSQWQSLPTSFAKGAGETLLQTVKGAKVMGETLMGTSSPDEVYFQPNSGPVTKDDFVNHLSSALGAFVPQTAIGALTGHLGTVMQGALQNSAQAYDEAKMSGADDDTAKLSAGLGLVIGSLAGLGPQAFGARLAKAQGDLLEKGWKSWAKETLQPAGVMAAQTFLNNVNAKIGAGYDPQRALSQGVAESGLIGGILGAGQKVFTTAANTDINQVKQKLVDMGIAQYSDKHYPRLSPSETRLFSGLPLSTEKDTPKEFAPWYYSQLERVVEQKFPNKMSVEQAKAMLTDPQRGIKAEEYEWSGLKDFLDQKESTNEPVLKGDLQKIIRQNRLELTEQVLGFDRETPKLKSLLEERQALEEKDNQLLWALKLSEQQFSTIESNLNNSLPEHLLQHGVGWAFANVKDQLSADTLAKYDLYNNALAEWRQIQDDRHEIFLRTRQLNSEIQQERAGTEGFDPEYASYSPLQGKNYKELLFHLPNDFEAPHFSKRGKGLLAHVRFNEAEDPITGKSRLQIQEIQSDLHQAGREQGYKPKMPTTAVEEYQAMEQKLKELKQQMDDIDNIYGNLDPDNIPSEILVKFNELNEQYQQIKVDRDIHLADYSTEPVYDAEEGVFYSNEKPPAAPFKNTWHELMFKRMLRYAAEKGYDEIVWPTGKSQVAMYEDVTRKNVDELHLLPGPRGRTLRGYKNGEFVTDVEIKNDKELEKYVGPSIAKKLLEQSVVKDSDLSIGGQMHRLLYDEKLPKFAQSIGKKFGAKYERKSQGDEEVHSFVIPETLKRSVLYEGQKLFVNPVADPELWKNFLKSRRGDGDGVSEQPKVNSSLGVYRKDGLLFSGKELSENDRNIRGTYYYLADGQSRPESHRLNPKNILEANNKLDALRKLGVDDKELRSLFYIDKQQLNDVYGGDHSKYLNELSGPNAYGNSMDGLDGWLATEARKAGYDTIKLNHQPDSEGKRNTEIVDLSEVGNKDGVQNVRASFAEDYHNAAKEFVKGSRGADEEGNPIEVFHGTQSPKEITELDFSKLDPNALYGPGFYMTQDRDVAAGEGGYASTKGSNVGPDELKNLRNSPNYDSALNDRLLMYEPDYIEYLKERGLDPMGHNPGTGKEYIKQLKEALKNFPETRKDYEQIEEDAAWSLVDEINKPHAYKLYHNIKNPFDIDAPIDSKLKEYFIKQGIPEWKLQTNQDAYNFLTFNNDRAATNEKLKEFGYDGITHLGGHNGNTKLFKTLDEAESYAKQTGGKLEHSKNLDLVPDAPYQVSGHRVWIAFDPKQVKSATGNRGTFDVNSPRISESIAEKPNLTEMEQRARDAGHIIALTPKTREEFIQESARLMESMKTQDPTSPEFLRDSQRWIELNRAITDSEGIENLTSHKDLQDHVRRINLGHEGDTEQMLKDMGSVMPEASSPDSEFVTGEAVDSIKEGGYKIVYGTESGKAPVLYMPDKVFEALGHKMVGGLNFPLRELPRQLERVKNSSLFTEPERQQAIESLRLIGRASDAEGLSSISLLNSNTHPINFQKVTHHETFHAGQQEALESMARREGLDPAQFDLRALHSSEWAQKNPYVDKFLETPVGQFYAQGRDVSQAKDILAYELAAFVAGGQYYHDSSEGAIKATGLTTGEGIDYLTDYIQHIYDTNGDAAIEAIDAMVRAAELRTNISETIDLARSLERANPNSIDAIKAKTNSQSDFGMEDSAIRASVSGSPEGGIESGESKDRIEELHPVPTGDGPPEGRDKLDFQNDWQSDPFFKVVVNDPFIQKTADVFKGLMDSEGVKYDPRIPPTIQIKDAILRGDLRPEKVEEALAKHGLTWDDYAEAMQRTVSTAGRVLSMMAQVERHYKQLLLDDPGLAKKLGEQRKFVERVLGDLERSKLGQNWYQRLSALQIKALLGTVHIAMNNVITTVARLPLDLVTPAMAGWIVGRKEFIKAKPDATMAEAAYAGAQMAKKAIQPAINVIMSLNPKELGQVIKGTKINWSGVELGRGERFQHYDDLVSSLEQYFPDYHSKLHGLSSGIETRNEDPSNWIKLVREIMPTIDDPNVKAKFEARTKILEERLKQNESLLGKTFNKVEWIYDLPLRPSNFQEFFFRRPYFVGALDRELALRGMSLHDMVVDGKLAEIPPEAMEAATDAALTFTFAYKPKADAPGTVGIERGVASIIKGINGMGILGHTVGEMLPQAMFNGAKFWYEYGALGAIRPAIKLANGKTRADMDFHDQHRLAQAAIGTMLYAGILSVAGSIFGDEWYKLKTGRKTKDGKPIYIDARGAMGQFAAFFFMAHTIHNYQKDRITDWKKVAAQGSEVFFNARKDTETSAALTAFQKMWGGSEPLSGEESKMMQGAGQFFATWIRPALNLRDAIAEFNAEENVKKDLKQNPLFGPSMDTIPWLRRRLPNLSLPGESNPIQLSMHPGVAQFTGVKLVEGAPAAKTEISRLGVSINKWLPRDTDPVIDRVQNQAFTQMIESQAEAFLKDPTYLNADEKMKRSMWEQVVTGKDGIAAYAKRFGQEANPLEMQKREVKRSIGPFTREAYGIDKQLEKIK